MSAATDRLLIALAERMSNPQQQFDPAALAALLKKEPVRHLDMSGNEITGDQNPFSNGFFKSSAASLTPEQLAQSQGGNAINQWKFPGKFQWGAPSTQSPAETAVAASPSPWQSMGSRGYQFQLPTPLERPESGTPAAGAWMDMIEAQDVDMMKPGGANQFWSNVGGPMTPAQAGARYAPFFKAGKKKAERMTMAGLR